MLERGVTDRLQGNICYNCTETPLSEDYDCVSTEECSSLLLLGIRVAQVCAYNTLQTARPFVVFKKARYVFQGTMQRLLSKAVICELKQTTTHAK